MWMIMLVNFFCYLWFHVLTQGCFTYLLIKTPRTDYIWYKPEYLFSHTHLYLTLMESSSDTLTYLNLVFHKRDICSVDPDQTPRSLNAASDQGLHCLH